MAFPKLSTTLYGRLFTQGKSYFETTLPKYSYEEKFKLKHYYLTGQFKWIPTENPNTYNSIITIQNLKTKITYNEYIRINSNQIMDYSFLTYKSDQTDKAIPSKLLNQLDNYEVVDNKPTYTIMK